MYPAPIALIFAGADSQRLPLLEFDTFTPDLIIAADSGVSSCLKAGFSPRLVIGDMDSADEGDLQRAAESGAQIRRYPAAKDETDMELALDYALMSGAGFAYVVGGLGGRLDHTLANIDLAAAYAELGIRVIFLDRWGRLTVLSTRHPSLDIHGDSRDIISLIPWSSEVSGITTEGLVFGLSRGTLRKGKSRGISNSISSGAARVEIESGVLLVTHIVGSGAVDAMGPVW